MGVKNNMYFMATYRSDIYPLQFIIIVSANGIVQFIVRQCRGLCIISQQKNILRGTWEKINTAIMYGSFFSCQYGVIFVLLDS